MKAYSEKERECQETFIRGGRFWHAYTNGKDAPIIFTSDDDYRFAMNVTAHGASVFPGVRLLTFAVMSNHFHFVAASSSEEDLGEFYKFIRKRLSRCFPVLKDIALSVKQIDSLQALRNTIAYVNRNGYVANPNYNPFSYPWGGGCCYYMNIQHQQTFSTTPFREKRAAFRSRVPDLPGDWEMFDGYIAPQAYCHIKFGEAFFHNSQHYFSLVSRNVESWSGVAVEIDDGEFLTDTELFDQVSKIIREEYRSASLREVPKAQKLDLARLLRKRFQSSNGQIRRTLGLSQYDLDTLFPLTAKK